MGISNEAERNIGRRTLIFAPLFPDNLEWERL